MKFTYAIVVSKMFVSLIVPSAQNMVDLNSQYNVKAYGYLLGTNEITGNNEVALPHVTLVQFHTSQKSLKIILQRTAEIIGAKQIAAESTPSGMLYESKIKYEFDFKNNSWIKYVC